jgi:hypothetical protein
VDAQSVSVGTSGRPHGLAGQDQVPRVGQRERCCGPDSQVAAGKLQDRKGHEKSLYSFLHDELGDVQVTKQYAVGRTAADIVVGEKVIIELKHNLNATSKLQRLFGQLEQYRAWTGPVIVLLTGDTEPNLRKELKRKLKEINERGSDSFVNFLMSDDDDDSRFQLVEK